MPAPLHAARLVRGDERGFVDERAARYFWPRHVDFVAETFGDLVFGWKPVNEPSAYALLGWRLGVFPPGIATPDGSPRRSSRSTSRRSTRPAACAASASRWPRSTTWRRFARWPTRPKPPSAPASSKPWDGGCWIGAFLNGELQVPGRGPVDVPGYGDAFDLVGFSYYGAQGVAADGSFVPYPTDARVGPLGYAPWSEGLGEVLHRLAEIASGQVPGRGPADLFAPVRWGLEVPQVDPKAEKLKSCELAREESALLDEAEQALALRRSANTEVATRNLGLSRSTSAGLPRWSRRTVEISLARRTPSSPEKLRSPGICCIPN